MSVTLNAVEQALRREQQEDLPLHSQVKRALRRLIYDQFSNGDRFFTETAIASELNISAGTVRRALSDLTREGLLVRRVAQGTFVRKPEAITGTSNATLYVMLPQFDSESFSSFLEAFEQEAARLSWNMEVHRTPRNQAAADAVSAIRCKPSESRVILLGTVPDITLDLNELLKARGFRTVTVDTLVERYKGAYAGTDDRMAITIGLDYLVGLGHRRVTLVVNEPNDQLSVSSRIDVFRDYAKQLELTQADVVLPPMKRWDHPFDSGYASMPQIWDQRVRPTAIMTISDCGAFGVMKWLAEQGAKIPQDVSVLGFENIPSARYTHPALTTIAQPIAETARRAIDMLLNDVVRHELVAPELVIRESTAPPAKEA